MDVTKSTREHLCDELNAFCDGYELPHGSADELLAGLYDLPQNELRELQIEYLENFISR